MERNGHGITSGTSPLTHGSVRQRVDAAVHQWLGALPARTARDYSGTLLSVVRAAKADGHPVGDAATFGLWAVDSPEAFAEWMQAYVLDIRRGAPATQRKRASTVGTLLSALRRQGLRPPPWRPELPARDLGSAHAPVAAASWQARAREGEDGLLLRRSNAIAMLAHCGLKTAEIQALRFPEAIAQMPLLRVGEDRVPVGAETWAALHRWIERRGSGPGWLFLDLEGRSGRITEKQVSTRAMQRGARGLGATLSGVRRRRILDEVTTRGVRHAAVVARVENPGDITAAIKASWSTTRARR